MSILLERLGLTRHPRIAASGEAQAIASENPATGKPIAFVRPDSPERYEQIVVEATEAFKRWRLVPAPVRGQVVRAIGEAIRAKIDDLGELVSLEVGKIRAEGRGEIQEIVDIADFAVGLSRQIPGQVLPSERPGHKLIEQWLPLGPVGVITAFNFPAAVWGWNAMVAAVCGDVVVWKPSMLAPLTAIACHELARGVAESMGHFGVFHLVMGGDQAIGERMIADKRLPLISATGSCRMGRRVGQVVAARLGRTLLELGGNNACIVHADANLDLALPSVLFGAVGTAGQRCTTTRRLLVHETIADRFVERLAGAYRQVAQKIGDPLEAGTLVGPLINSAAVEGFSRAVKAAREQGGTVVVGGEVIRGKGGHFVQPTLIRAKGPLPISMEETFAPILYVFTYGTIDKAIAMNNAVDQGLSSAIFTESLMVSERFLSAAGAGSDCGLANVNCGTSGAEIGGAFGGEKDTGGGRESGSDSWKAYMRRQTSAINASGTMVLAQGIQFG